MTKVNIIGAGLAGCEAAMFLAKKGVKITLFEQKPQKRSPAHHNDGFAELVCSNSLKAERVNSAGGLLKAEMRLFGSICLEAADSCRVPAGGALAVDREAFSQYITEAVANHPNITVVHTEVEEIPQDAPAIVATGPLTDGVLAENIAGLTGAPLSFFDAAAPIITAESVDMKKAFFQSRYDRGEPSDYLNCPMDKAQYEIFYNALVGARIAELHEFDRHAVYEGCMPIEVMAARGENTMRFGPLKPVGLTDGNTGRRPYAVLQLRKENVGGTLYNLVGFQTNLKFGEQKRVFSLIPALKNAEFARYGVMHRNTFINSPRLLDSGFRLKGSEDIYFAGQITGVEGYMESAMSGIIAAAALFLSLNGKPPLKLPNTTMTGALTGYISDTSVKDFQPMGANFGLLPPLDTVIKNKQERYESLASRALEDMKEAIRPVIAGL